MHPFASPTLVPPPVHPAPGLRAAALAPRLVLADVPPPPREETLRGFRLVLVWLAMLVASWLVAVGLGYGLFLGLRVLAG